MNDFISTETGKQLLLRFLRAKIVINRNTGMLFVHKMNKTPTKRNMFLSQPTIK